jgi:hypothetical protein
MVRKASWIVLTVVGGVWLVLSLFSANTAYRLPQSDTVGGHSFAPTARLRADGQPVPTLEASDAVKIALRARRGTAAAHSAGFATLYLCVVLVPYRRGDTWAWWAILGSMGVLLLVTLLRLPTLHTTQGLAVAAALFALSVLALLLDVGRLRRA